MVTQGPQEMQEGVSPAHKLSSLGLHHICYWATAPIESHDQPQIQRVEKQTVPLEEKGRICDKIQRDLALGCRQNRSFRQGWE